MDLQAQTSSFLRLLSRAETATADQGWALAADLWNEVVSINPVEGYFWTRLAEARYENKTYDDAIAASEKALELCDWFPAEAAYRIACCQAQIGDREAAITAFQRALDLGFRSLERARTDDALAALRDDPRFRDQTGMIDTSQLSRDEGWRADLRFLWGEVRRLAYDLFRHHPEATFAAKIAEIDRAIPELSDLQILLEFQRLIVLLGDGHAGVYPDPELDSSRRGLPVQFYLFEEGLFIIAGAPAHRDLLGARVLEFDGTDVETVMAAVEPLICRDNEIWVKQSAPHRLREVQVLHALGLTGSPETVTLTLLDLKGATREVSLTTDPRYSRANLQRHFFRPAEWITLESTLDEPVPLYLRQPGLPHWYEALSEERTVYAQINSVRNAPGSSLPDFGDRMVDAAERPGIDRLVLDLRWNPGGNTFLEMHLLNRLIGSTKLNRQGHLFVIIGRATFSAAQNFSTLLDRHTEAIFVGEPTGSSPTFVGETMEFRLPYSKAYANVSDLLWQSGWAMDYRTWLAPLLYTPPTFAAYRNNLDPAMEAIRGFRAVLPGTKLSPRINVEW